MTSQFGELVQNFELKRVGGAPKSHQFAPLVVIFNLLLPMIITLLGIWIFLGVSSTSLLLTIYDILFAP